MLKPYVFYIIVWQILKILSVFRVYLQLYFEVNVVKNTCMPLMHRTRLKSIIHFRHQVKYVIYILNTE